VAHRKGLVMAGRTVFRIEEESRCKVEVLETSIFFNLNTAKHLAGNRSCLPYQLDMTLIWVQLGPEITRTIVRGGNKLADLSMKLEAPPRI
jgi:hypothetical protein